MTGLTQSPRQSLNGLRVAVTGAGGQLGSYLREALTARGANVTGLGHRAAPGIDLVADLADRDALHRAIGTAEPGLVIHAAAYTDVDGCERDPDRAEQINTRGSAHVAHAARAAGAQLMMISTDYVFGGDGGAPYGELDPPSPISAYGRSKLGGELAVLDVCADFAVVRTAWLFGGRGKHFPRTVLTLLRDRRAIEVVTDEWGSPTYARDLAEALVQLSTTAQGGVFHLVNARAASRFELARAVALTAGFDPKCISGTRSADYLARYPLPARRPANSSLANNRAAALGIELRPWRDAIQAYVPDLASELGVHQNQITTTEGAGQS